MKRTAIDTVAATHLAKWLSSASHATRSRLSGLLGTSGNMLLQWSCGKRNLSAGRAGAVVAAMRLIAQTEKDAPRPLTRGNLCRACRECEYFQTGEMLDVDDLK